MCVRSLLHLLNKEVCNLSEQVLAGVAAIDAVVAVGVDILLEVLVSLDESLGVLEGVLRVYVVVGQSVTEEQCAREVVDT